MDGPNVFPVKVKREEIDGGKESHTVFGVRSVGKRWPHTMGKQGGMAIQGGKSI